MIFRLKHRSTTWHSLFNLLLILAMIVAPVVSVMAEQHEIQHVEMGDVHFDNDHDANALHADAGQNDLTTVLHDLAHVSHCCGVAVAMLPSMLNIQLFATASSLGENNSTSLLHLQSTKHFRPPIVL